MYKGGAGDVLGRRTSDSGSGFDPAAKRQRGPEGIGLGDGLGGLGMVQGGLAPGLGGLGLAGLGVGGLGLGGTPGVDGLGGNFVVMPQLMGGMGTGAGVGAAAGGGGGGGGGFRHGHGQLPVVKLRGLPFRCEEADVVEFFAGLEVVDVLLVRKNMKLAGEAFVVFPNLLQVELALQRNRMNMGRRYIEIFRMKKSDFYNAVANEVEQDGGSYKGIPEEARYPPPRDREGGGPSRGFRHRDAADAEEPRPAGEDPEHTAVLKLRGLPFSATKQDIMRFFDGFTLEEASIHVVTAPDGRNTGEAFVEFVSGEDAKAAMSRDRSLIGTRYIELYRSSREDAMRAATRGQR